MILQALSDYYLRLENDPDVDIAPYGYSSQNIAFCIVLEPDGTLFTIEDVRTEDKKKKHSIKEIVPGGAKPSGSGINPNFIWDKTDYLLGYKTDDPKPERTLKSFEEFRQKHLDLEKTINDPEFSAICHFLKNHQSGVLPENGEFLKELASGFGLFKIRGKTHFVHESKKIKQFWDESHTNSVSDDSVRGECLVTGETTVLARLHEPKIKGVANAQSAGAAIVSFNLDSFESYNKEQSFNAPVSENIAFQYCTGLNYLLRIGSRQRLLIGDSTVVFWTEKPTKAEEFMGMILDSGSKSEDESTRKEIENILLRISKGHYAEELGEPDTPFYILGLSPNAARVSIRFWHVSSLSEMVNRLAQHFQDLEMVHGERDPDFPSAWQLLRETVRDSKDISPHLAGALMRAVLTGEPYPDSLYSTVLRRIRLDQKMNYLRASILKACLNRKLRSHQSQFYFKEVSMALDESRTDKSYLLGRLFAALEKCQEDALPGINATIKDRFFGAASSTPASVFPRLIRLNQHHMNKLDGGFRVNHNKRIQQIFSMLEIFPSHLNLQEQGLFAIGYYHQRQDLFTSKKKKNDSPEEE